MADKNVGRPRKFESVEELQEKIQEYFKSCWRKKLDMFGNPIKDKETEEQIMEQFKPYTITGMAVYLDTTRETLLDYEKLDGFSDTIKVAKEMCHAYAEESLFVGKNPSGAIFSLKNNWGWTDKQEIDQTVKGDMTVTTNQMSKEELEAEIKKTLEEISQLIPKDSFKE